MRKPLLSCRGRKEESLSINLQIYLGSQEEEPLPQAEGNTLRRGEGKYIPLCLILYSEPIL